MIFRFQYSVPLIQLVVIIIGFLTAYGDYPLIIGVHKNIQGFMKEVLEYVTQLGLALPWLTVFILFIMFGMFVGKNFWKYYCIPALFSIINMLSVGTVLNVIKIAVGRLRPKYFLNDHMSFFHPMSLESPFGLSFPSGHSQAVWSAAVCFGLMWPQYRKIFMGIAAVVSLSRFLLTQHYLSDVLVGAMLGFYGSLYFYKRYGARFLHHEIWKSGKYFSKII